MPTRHIGILGSSINCIVHSRAGAGDPLGRWERPRRWGRMGGQGTARRRCRRGLARRVVVLWALVAVPALPGGASAVAADPAAATAPEAGPQAFASEPNRTWGTSP